MWLGVGGGGRGAGLVVDSLFHMPDKGACSCCCSVKAGDVWTRSRSIDYIIMSNCNR